MGSQFLTFFLCVTSGDGDGQTEMNECMGYLRKFMNGFADQAEATRVFFPDNVVRYRSMVFLTMGKQQQQQWW